MLRFELHLILLLTLASWTSSGVVWAVGKPAAVGGGQRCYTAASSAAITYCTEAIESGQLSGKALGFAFYRRANAYNEVGEPDRAIADYNQAIRINPNHAGSFSNRGVAHTRKGNYDRAIEDYDQAIRIKPTYVDAFTNRGVAYARKGDYDRAIQDYDEAIRLDDHSANAFYARGNAFRRKGDYDRAIEDYNEAIRLNPKQANAFSNRAIAYGRKGDYDRAIEDYNVAIGIDPKHINALYNRGNAYRRTGDYNRAVQDYDEVIRLNPKHASAYSGRGAAHFYQNRFPAAAADFSEAARLSPKDLYPIIMIYLARARGGVDAPSNLAQSTRGMDLTEWPGPIISMYLDQLSDTALLDFVGDSDAQSQRRCQAYFHVGQKLLLDKKRSDAINMFRKATAVNSPTVFEYEAAHAELKRLDN
jgi:tetratricopeptide (TPR) repeat protein